MKVLVHDVDEKTFSLPQIIENEFVAFNAKDNFAHCVGCYKCWLKTPGTCVINDELKNIGALMGNSEETIIISQNVYGGYSEKVKIVLDRSISGSMPFFTYRSGKLRHTKRYKIIKKCLTVIFYGNYLETEKTSMEMIVEANRSNMGFREAKLIITESMEKIKEYLNEYTDH
jgi:multimeric flavodoxin WrbA